MPTESVFGQLRGDAPLLSVAPLSASATATGGRARASRKEGGVRGRDSRGFEVSGSDLRNQFVLYSFDRESGGIVPASKAAPIQEGSDDVPDTAVDLQLESFHVGQGEDVDSRTRATMRLDLGKDEAARSHLDTLFWSIAAGLELYDDTTSDNRPRARDLQSNFTRVCGRRAEIPGSLASLSFEVVKHKEPPWWSKVFRFIQSDTGKKLTSALGFPGITSQAISFIDELVGRLVGEEPEVLFKSRKMTFALTEKAKEEFTGGLATVEVGVLNPGIHLLARGRDLAALAESKPIYMGQYGLLRPGDTTEEGVLSGEEHALSDLTYAILRVGTRPVTISPGLDY